MVPDPAGQLGETCWTSHASQTLDYTHWLRVMLTQQLCEQQSDLSLKAPFTGHMTLAIETLSEPFLKYLYRQLHMDRNIIKTNIIRGWHGG